MYPCKSNNSFSDGSRELSRAEQTIKIARRLIEIEKGKGRSLEQAKRHVAEVTGISYWTIREWWWGSTAADVLPGTWRRVVTAYRLECAHQTRCAQEEEQRAIELLQVCDGCKRKGDGCGGIENITQLEGGRLGAEARQDVGR